MEQSPTLAKPIGKSMKKYPLLKEITALKPVFWINPSLKDTKETPKFLVHEKDMFDAERRWQRFTTFFQKSFPETKETKGIIESPLRQIPQMKRFLEQYTCMPIPGRLYLKCDNELPIAGSIKARGGIYEVLKHAETLALEHGLLSKEDSYEVFASERFRNFFSQYTISVGSTGNLGLSIGLMGTKLGFHVRVHMSKDAKSWKKKLLREKGAEVYEYEADFSKAIAEGREQSSSDERSYFVDDENSQDLFLGYSTAALRLRNQLDQEGIRVDASHPLFVYLPCGVGGSPGGITFGLKCVFGSSAHCFFVEPTHSPSVLIGLLTKQYEKISVQDFGIDNHTEADGLAVGTPSSFATPISRHLVSGIYTIHDDELFHMLSMLIDAERMKIEPSAAAGLPGPIRLLHESSYIRNHGLSGNLDNATHIIWATGGALVPNGEMERFYQKGKRTRTL